MVLGRFCQIGEKFTMKSLTFFMVNIQEILKKIKRNRLNSIVFDHAGQP